MNESDEVQKIKELLSSVFTKDKVNKYRHVNHTKGIQEILKFLLTSEESSKKQMLIELKNIFTENKINLIIFMRYTFESKSLYEILILTCLQASSNDLLELCYALLIDMTEVITIKKSVYKFLNLQAKLADTPEKFTIIIKLLSILYFTNEHQKDIFYPSNFFYFSKQSEIIIDNLQDEKALSFSKGLNIGLWFQLSYDEKDMNGIFSNAISTLLKIGLQNQDFSLIIDKDNNLMYDEKKLFHFEKQVMYFFILKSKMSSKTEVEFEIMINEEKITNFKYKILSKEIIKVSLFKDFYGICPSIIIYKGSHPGLPEFLIDNETKTLSLKTGFYREEFFYPLISEKDVLNSSMTNFKAQNYSDGKCIEDNFEALGKGKKDIISIYMPTRTEMKASTTNIILSDAISNKNGELIIIESNTNGVHIHDTSFYNVKLVGGMKNFLPYFELISKKDALKTPEIFRDLLFIIPSILSGRSYYNIISSGQEKFFSCLSLFIEKFPDEMFNEKIFGLLKTISNGFITDDSYKDANNDYHNNILTNEKIIFKFESGGRKNCDVWRHISTITSSNQNCEIVTMISVRKMLSILLHYDEEKYNKFCCEAHYNIFKHEKDEKPEFYNMNERLDSLEEFIDLMILGRKNKEIIQFFILLSLDISPCLQKFILKKFLKLYKESRGQESFKFLWDESIVDQILNISIFLLSFTTMDNKVLTIDLIFYLLKYTVPNEKYKTVVNSLNWRECFIEDNILYTRNLVPVPPKEEQNESTKQEPTVDSAVDSIFSSGQSLMKEIFPDGPGDMIVNEFLFKPIVKEKNTIFLTEILKEDVFFEEAENLVNVIISYLKEKCLVSLSIKCLIKLGTYSPRLTSIFLPKIDEIVKEKSNILTISKTNFINWLLDTSFQWYLIDTVEGYNLPGLSNLEKESQKSLSASIHPNGLNIISIICKEDIKVIDKVLTWGAYYKVIFEDNRNYYNALREFIFIIFKITITLLLNANDDPLGEKNKKSIMYFFSFLFEFSTFYKMDNVFDNLNSRESVFANQKNYIKLPSYFQSSYIMEPDMENGRQRGLNEKWKEYGMMKNIYEKFEFYWKNRAVKFSSSNPHKNHEQIFNNYVVGESHSNKFNDELIELTSISNDFNFTKRLQPIPVIYILTDFFAIVLKEVEIATEVNEWLENVKEYLSFLIIASLNLKKKPKENENDQNEIQNRIKTSVFFLLSFIINESSERLEYANQFFELGRDILYLLLDLYELMRDKIEKEKQKESNTGFMQRGFQRAKNWIPFLSSDNGTENFYIFKTIEECLSQIVNKESFRKDLLNSLKDSYGEKEGNKIKSFKDLLSGELLKEGMEKAFTANLEIKKMEEMLFNFKDINSKRKMNIKNLIPYYNIKSIIKDNNIPYDNSENMLCLISNYYRESSFSSLKKTIETQNTEIKKLIKISEIEDTKAKAKKIKRYNYYKKRMFSFRGLWSDEDIFYDGKFRYQEKLVNHYTRDFTRILMTPIIDIKDYLPPFSEFEPKDLFHENTNKLTGNITDLIKEEEEEEEAKQEETEEEKNKKDDDNDIDWEFVNNNSSEETKLSEENKEPEQECFQKDKNIYFAIYQRAFNFVNQKLKAKKSNEKREKQEIFKKFIELNLKVKKPRNQKRYIFECCIVTQAYHIKGFFFNEDANFGFYAYDLIVDKNSEEFDHDRNTCFGSVFKAQVSKRNQYHFLHSYKEIEMILKRRYFFRRNSIEIFTYDKKSIFIKFKSQKDAEDVIENFKGYMDLSEIKSKCSMIDKIIGYVNQSNDFYSSEKTPFLSLGDKYDKWKNWKISTLELIMYLNLYGNRSYNDLMQYPVFPWVIMNFKSDELNASKKNTFRPLDKPVGMIVDEEIEESKSRKENYIQHYQNMKEEEEEVTEGAAYFYGSHYSNALYVAHYLVRVFPYCYLQIEMQGKGFDDPNRLFNSVPRSFECVITQKCDVRELIPEFYCFPEFFYNLCDLNLGEIKNAKGVHVNVQDVEMPNWCVGGGAGYQFVEVSKRVLETDNISSQIHAWFDLIFGSKQKGSKAVSSNNLFIEESYEDFEKKFDKKDLSQKSYSLRMVEFGVTPSQIFNSDCDKRNDWTKNFTELYSGDKELTVETISKSIPNSPVYCKILPSNKGATLILTSYSEVKYYPITRKSKGSGEAQQYEYELGKIKNIRKIPILPYRKREFSSKPPIAVYDNGEVIAVGGFYNGRVKLYYNEKPEGLEIFEGEDMSLVTTIVIDQDENFAFVGTERGGVRIYLIDSEPVEQNSKDRKYRKTKWKEHDEFFDHSGPITSISVSNKLNMFITTSKDGYIMIYTFPKCKLVNSFIVGTTNIYPSMSLISSSPLPTLILYIKEVNKIFTYNINGRCIKCDFVESEILSMKTYTDHMFNDHLVYSTVNGEISFKDLPLLQNTEVSKSIQNSILDFDISEGKGYGIILEGDKVHILKDPKTKINF